MKTRRILIVDDEEDARIFLSKVILKYEHNIVEMVTSVLDAIYKFSENPYNILITDINMHGFSGLFLIYYIKTFFPDCKIIATSADCSTLEYAKKVGASICLLKPFTVSEVMEKVMG